VLQPARLRRRQKKSGYHPKGNSLSPGDFRTKNFHHCTIQRLKGAIPRKKPEIF